MTPLTEEQKADVEQRTEEFKRRYGENVKELEIDFISFPQYVQVGPNLYSTLNQMQLMDTKYAPTPSPLSDESGLIEG